MNYIHIYNNEYNIYIKKKEFLDLLIIKIIF